MYFKPATNHCVSQISVNFGVSIRASEVLVNQNCRIRLTSIRRHKFPAARSAHRYFETAEPALNATTEPGQLQTCRKWSVIQMGSCILTGVLATRQNVRSYCNVRTLVHCVRVANPIRRSAPACSR
jgi:hypothetical protein